MAQIVINEISQNYTWNIGTNSYATVAMPITSCWGPGYFDPDTYYGDTLSDCEDPHEFMLEHTAWQRFPATQRGLEAFVSTYRGPSSIYRRAKDYSYQMAITLLTAGYDVLVCRLSPGALAGGSFKQLQYFIGKDGKTRSTIYSYVAQPGDDPKYVAKNNKGDWVEVDLETKKKKADIPASDFPAIEEAIASGKSNPATGIISFRAKYPGTFGNNIQVTFKKNIYFDRDSRTKKIYWSIITHIIDSSGVKTSAENLSVVFNMDNASDSILYYKEVESAFWDVSIEGDIDEGSPETLDVVCTPYPVMYYTTTKTLRYNPETEQYDTVEVNVGDEVTPGYCPSGYKSSIERMHFVRLADGTDIQPRFIDSETKEVTRRPYSEAQERNEYSMTTFERVINARYSWADLYNTDASDEIGSDYTQYPKLLIAPYDPLDDSKKYIESFEDDDLEILFYKEWLYTHLVGRQVKDNYDSGSGAIIYEGVFDLIKDKLAYNPNRIIASGWDDQNYLDYIEDPSLVSTYVLEGKLYKDRDDSGEDEDDCPNTCMIPPSPLHLKLMDVAYYSRCGTSLIDIPHVVDRKYVHIEDEWDLNRQGYIQKLARVVPYNAALDVNGSLYHTHSALFAPWGQYRYVGTSRMVTAAPAFLALMIQRAQILNQPNQYEWALPTNRKHNLRIGKLDYTVPKKILDKWQKLDGASVNVITTIPDLGTNLWGNSTLFEVPPATYQALANLSTRYLVNAVENCAYRCGIGITFQYNNEQAYNKFYAGVTPLLDTMKNLGAIEGYKITMSADINGLDQVNANTVIGKIWLLVNGVINDIYVDLIALPAGAGIDLDTLS